MTEKIELATVESVDGDVFHDRKFEILGSREFDTVEDALEETSRISRKYHENKAEEDRLRLHCEWTRLFKVFHQASKRRHHIRRYTGIMPKIKDGTASPEETLWMMGKEAEDARQAYDAIKAEGFDADAMMDEIIDMDYEQLHRYRQVNGDSSADHAIGEEMLRRHRYDVWKVARSVKFSIVEKGGIVVGIVYENGDQYDDLPEDYTFEKLVEEELI